MSPLANDGSAKNGTRFSAVRLFEGLVVAALLGTLLGLADFFLFETHSQRHVMHELVFFKPSFWSLSLLSYQIVALTVLATSLYSIFFFFAKFSSKFIKFFKRVSPLYLSIFFSFFLIFTFRFLKNSNQRMSLVVFASCLPIFILFVHIYKRRIPKNGNTFSALFRNRIFLTYLFIAIFSFLIPFLAPDLAFFVSRMSPPKEAQNSEIPNVLLIVLDTVRADRLSCYGYGKSETPNIDSIAKSGLLFLNAFSTAPWTVPSHASMFTGLYPSRHHANFVHPHLASEHLTLAEYLRDLGYRTAGFSENPFLGVNHGLEQGFTEFHEPWRHPMIMRAINEFNTISGLHKDRHEYAHRTSDLFRRWIIEGADDGRPFFAYINFMAAHLPRYPRKTSNEVKWSAETLRRIEPVNLVPERFYLEKYNIDENDLSVMREIYDQEISHIDVYIGEIYDLLKETEIIDDTILIITSDHGENFGDHGFIEHTLCLYNSLTHVPLIIKLPKNRTPQVISRNVSTSGLFLTIVDLLNLKNRAIDFPKIDFMMPSILQTPEDQTIIAEHANALKMLKNAVYSEAPDHDFSRYDRDLKSLIIGGRKYIWYSTGGEELFDLRVDPLEERDIAAREPGTVERFRQILMESTNVGTDRPQFENVPPVDAATRDALRALGYEH